MSTRRLIAIVAALVILRSAIWLAWEQAYFDSDQAVYGLMAIHISQGRAWPVFMYGQTYVLALESWIAAPLFALFGPSVFLFKLPLIVMNIATAIGLVIALRRDSALRSFDALVASLFFVLPPLITSSRLMEASGGNIEPLLFTVWLWLARRRPLVFGLLAGVSVSVRVFGWYAVVALAIIDVWAGALTRDRLRQWLVSAITMAVVLVAVERVSRHSDALGPDSGPPGDTALIGAEISSLRPNIRDTIGNLDWLVTRNMPVLFGLWPQRLARYRIGSELFAGTALAVVPMVCLALAVVWIAAPRLPAWIRAIRERHRTRPESDWQFPVYLCLIGIQTCVAFVLVGPGARDLMLIRYTLLVLLGAVGLTTWLLKRASGVARTVVMASVLVWTSLAAWDHIRLAHEYATDTPVNEPRQVIATLDTHQVRFGIADYWIAYLVDFISNERIVLAPDYVDRIPSYRRAVDVAPDAVTITNAARCAGPDPVRVGGWCISGLPR